MLAIDVKRGVAATLERVFKLTHRLTAILAGGTSLKKMNDVSG